MTRERERVKYEGKVLFTKKLEELEVLKYYNSEKVLIRFIKTGYTRFTYSSSLRKGNVKDKYSPDRYGFYLGDTTTSDSKGADLRSYTVWLGMRRRCYYGEVTLVTTKNVESVLLGKIIVILRGGTINFI